MFSIFHHRSDSEAALRRLLRDYQEPLYWHIRRMVGNHEDAQDALQEAFVRVYRNLDSLKNASSERAWIFRIATNEALRLIEQRAPHAETADIDDHDPPATEDADYEALQHALAAAVNLLPTRQRAVFSMRYYDEMSYEDIALALDSNVKAVTANYHTAKERIKSHLLAL